MSEKLWARAAWVEGNQEEEGVIPACWIQANKFRWPNVNAIKALSAMANPGQNWWEFKLVKVKLKSADKKACEAHDHTTTVESSSDEDLLPKKRVPRRKSFPDFDVGVNSESHSETRDKQPGANQNSTSSKAITPPPLPKVPPKVSAVDISCTDCTSGSRQSIVLAETQSCLRRQRDKSLSSERRFREESNEKERESYSGRSNEEGRQSFRERSMGERQGYRDRCDDSFTERSGERQNRYRSSRERSGERQNRYRSSRERSGERQNRYRSSREQSDERQNVYRSFRERSGERQNRYRSSRERSGERQTRDIGVLESEVVRGRLDAGVLESEVVRGRKDTGVLESEVVRGRMYIGV